MLSLLGRKWSKEGAKCRLCLIYDGRRGKKSSLLGQKWSKMAIFDQKCPKMIIFGQKWSFFLKKGKMSSLLDIWLNKGQKVVFAWPKIVKNGHFWPKMSKNGHFWPKMVNFCWKKGQNVVFAWYLMEEGAKSRLCLAKNSQKWSIFFGRRGKISSLLDTWWKKGQKVVFALPKMAIFGQKCPKMSKNGHF